METIVYTLLFILLFSATIILLGIATLTLTHKLWLPVVLSEFAEHHFFVTTVEEGTGRLIRKFGKAWRFITSDHKNDPDPDDLNPESWDVTHAPYPNGRRLKTADGYEPWWVEWIDSHLPGGMRWVGFPFVYSIPKYNFRWENLREGKPVSTEDSLVEARPLGNGKYVASFAKEIDYIFLRDSTYYFEISVAETRGADSDSKDKSVGMPVTINMVVTVRIVNPYKALVSVHDWLGTSLGLLRPSIRS